MSYDKFAYFYDTLTQNIDYKERADYIFEILKNINHHPEILLDLACGTGSLSIEFAKKKADVIAVDGSCEMLSIAQQKAYEQQQNILFLNQRMERLNLYGTVDTVVCSLDSINHVTQKSLVQKIFDRIYLFLDDNGIFIFDANTILKHQRILANNTFIYDMEDVFCAWQNTLEDDGETVTIHLDFFEKSQDVYVRSEEQFQEKAYSIDLLSEMLGKSGFEIIDIYDHMTFERADESSEKVEFIVRKVKRNG